MPKFYASTLLLISLLITGCANTAPKEIQAEPDKPQRSEATGAKIIVGEQPEWVEGDIIAYPRLHYMTVRAQGSTEEKAANAAKAKMTRLFVVDIEKLKIPMQQALDASGFEINTTHLGDEVQTIASEQARRVLRKIKVAEVWHDAEKGVYHALATLARNTGKGYLVKQVKLLDERTLGLIKEARNANTDPLIQAGKLAKAWRVQQLRAAFQTSLKKADLTGRGIKSEWNPDSLAQDAGGLLTTLQIEATGLAEDMNAHRVSTMLQGGLRVAGIKPPVNEPDYIMRGTLDVKIIGERNSWAVGGGELKLALTDNVTGEVRGTKTWNIEVPGLDEEAAIRRVYEKTEYMLKVNMRNILLEISMQK